MKNRHIYIFFFLIYYYPLIASEKNYNILSTNLGSPFTQKFYFPNDINVNSNISIYEHPLGFFLIGTQNKMIIFYGNEFVNIPVEGKVNIIQNQNALFYTGINTVGLIKIFNNSLPQLIPLIDKKTLNKSIGQIHHVYLVNNYLLFNNDKYIFLNTGNYDLEVIDSSKLFIQLFRINDTIYSYKPESGLSKFENGKFISIQGTLLGNSRIISFLYYNNGILIKTNNFSHWYYLNSNKLLKLKFHTDDLLNEYGISSVKLLPTESFAISTYSNGILFYNPVNNLNNWIRVEEGILDNEVYQIHTDNTGNLWTFHKRGITRIEMNLHISVIEPKTGFSGTIYDIKKFGNHIWLATSTGLYTQLKKYPLIFEPHPIIRNKLIKLDAHSENIFAFSSAGIYILNKQGKKTLFYPIKINDIDKLSLNNKNYYAIGNDSGLFLIQIKPQKVLIDTFSTEAIESLICNNNGVFFKNYAQHIGFISAKKILNKINTDLIYYIDNSPDPKHFLKTQKGIRVLKDFKVFGINTETLKLFEARVNLSKNLEGINYLTEIIQKDSSFWFAVSGNLEQQKGILYIQKMQGNLRDKMYFFSTGIIQSPILLDSNLAYIGGDNKIYCFDYSKPFKYDGNFGVLIKRVIINKDSILHIELADPEISYKYNSINFIVSATNFENASFTRYQYRLIGLEKQWSDWTFNATKTYINLPPGNYTFQVRALNIDGNVSQTTELNFYILYPFYNTLPAYIVYFIIFLFLLFIYLRYRTWKFIKKKEEIDNIVQKRTAEILKEKEKSETLIANLLPKETADELKQTGKASSQKFTMATVLFSDIQGFTKIAEQMNPEMLIDQLDSFFFYFDSVIEKYNIEKIKTIGDAYMCAGGIPNKNITNPIEVVLAALEMIKYLQDLKKNNSHIWDLRIGIHTGSVIAGVVGHKKLSYDIWGDTVNTASRMESSGEPGKINISGQTYELVKDFFECEYRGKMPVKYKGEIDMYFVKSIKYGLYDVDPYTPNEIFFTNLQLLRIQDIEEIIFKKFENELPKNLYFHNKQRLQENYKIVKEISALEGLSKYDQLLLLTVSLLMDIGYIWAYDGHETQSIEFAKDFLPKYKYNNKQIDTIIKLIEFTNGMRKPENKLEEILADVEMFYYTQPDFEDHCMLLFHELQDQNKTYTIEEWLKMQIVLLSNHRFYTSSANNLRKIPTEYQIEQLMRKLENL